MDNVIEQVTIGGFYPPEQPTRSFDELVAQNLHLKIRLKSLEDENAILRNQVTLQQATALKLKEQLEELKRALNAHGIEL